MSIFIAEIKIQSPFGYRTGLSFAYLMEIAIEHGDWISVHDNALWGGDYESIAFVRKHTKKPILAKGLHKTDDDIKKALDHGAESVLVVDRLPKNLELLRYCVLEFADYDSLMFQLNAYGIDYKNRLSLGVKTLCNSRDLRTGQPKPDTQIQRYIDDNLWVCQASNIQSKDQVNPNVQAHLVGEHLLQFVGHSHF